MTLALRGLPAERARRRPRRLTQVPLKALPITTERWLETQRPRAARAGAQPGRFDRREAGGR
ncbi:MAG: hypothetical protein WDN24_07075 [Sphingomonas sp.]